jgi:arylsulfatase A-like enzyme
MLSGRTPNRECITGAEGCGQQPAYSCADKLPFPPTTFTVAKAAKKAGYATIHIGKWFASVTHLVLLFKPASQPTNHAATHPANHSATRPANN